MYLDVDPVDVKMEMLVVGMTRLVVVEQVFAADLDGAAILLFADVKIDVATLA